METSQKFFFCKFWFVMLLVVNFCISIQLKITKKAKIRKKNFANFASMGGGPQRRDRALQCMNEMFLTK